MKFIFLFSAFFLFASCDAQTQDKDITPSAPELIKVPYKSVLDNSERYFYTYLPKGYHTDSLKKWPVLLHLHGNGARGNGHSDLIWVTKHGPLMEAWVQKRDLPFIIIVPQLHMLGMDTLKSYIANRDTNSIPRRLEIGTPKRIPVGKASTFKGPKTSLLPYPKEGNIRGWFLVEDDLLGILDKVNSEFNGDSLRTYLTGLSYGGFGTWYMGSRHPERFAAIAPISAWGHPDLMQPIAKNKLPFWCFAGGKDQIIYLQHYYPGMQKLKELGYRNYRFTIEDNLGHDLWKRVYAGSDLYSWLLTHSLDG